MSLSGPVRIQSDRFGSGAAADVVITANTVEVRDGASMSVNNFFAGPGGSLTIDAQEVLLSGDNNPGFTGLAAQSFFSPFYGGIPLDPAGPAVPLDPALSFRRWGHTHGQCCQVAYRARWCGNYHRQLRVWPRRRHIHQSRRYVFVPGRCQ